MKCPNCGAETNAAVCEYCGTQINNPQGCCKRCGSPNLSFRRENQGEINGKKSKQIVRRTVGVCNDCGYTWFEEDTPLKKRKTWLWVFGWIFIFPLPLTILMVKNKKLKLWAKILIIAAAWGLYLLIVLTGNRESAAVDTGKQGDKSIAIEADQSKTDIKELSFSNDDTVTVKVGQKYTGYNYLSVTTNSRKTLKIEDIVWCSTNPDVAIISFSKKGLNNLFYFEIEGISGGEAEVYAKSWDGRVESEHIKVIVPNPIGIETIVLTPEKTELCLNEKTKIVLEIFPNNAEDKTVSWISSDESVAVVDDKGMVFAIGEGTATITAKSKNNVAASFEITVDGNKRLMNLRIQRVRQDDYNIGDEWSYLHEINGEKTVSSYALSQGDKLLIHVKYTESDDNPDIGEASTTYIVKEEDIKNGFTISLEVYVRENGGKNSGKNAHFIVKYIFAPASR